ncbi:hypothetical protein QAD02_006746 [Eretmocerus hayati]|uniref:Uncharacterized protein n=1 Tax=Eretmocerus hayati TaxID=131215 RepID=A0ACC2N218_9HYME|nr:hypothetical protein QAD02_006746 [Eretmocerus hayati]
MCSRTSDYRASCISQREEKSETVVRLIGKRLYIDGFVYVKKAGGDDGRIYWRCRRYRKEKCLAKATTSDPTSSENIIVYSGLKESTHNHRPSFADREWAESLEDSENKSEEETQKSDHSTENSESDSNCETTSGSLPETEVQASKSRENVAGMEVDDAAAESNSEVPTGRSAEEANCAVDSDNEIPPDSDLQTNSQTNKSRRADETMEVDDQGTETESNRTAPTKKDEESRSVSESNNGIPFAEKVQTNESPATPEELEVDDRVVEVEPDQLSRSKPNGKSCPVECSITGPNNETQPENEPTNKPRSAAEESELDDWVAQMPPSRSTRSRSKMNTSSVKGSSNETPYKSSLQRSGSPSSVDELEADDQGNAKESVRLPRSKPGKRICYDTALDYNQDPSSVKLLGNKLLINKFIYVRKDSNNQVTRLYWRCKKYGTGSCNGTAITSIPSADQKLIIYKGPNESEHSHPPNLAEVKEAEEAAKKATDSDNDVDPSPPRLIGRRFICIDGYVYKLNESTKEGKTRWECKRYRKDGCRGRALTSDPTLSEILVVFKGPKESKHDHPRSQSDVEEAEQEAKAQKKKKIRQQQSTDENPKKKLQSSSTKSEKSEESSDSAKKNCKSASNSEKMRKVSAARISKEPQDVKLMCGKLHIDGHVYVKDQISEKYITWHCKKFSKKRCPARATTNNPFKGGELTLIARKQQDTKHNHAPLTTVATDAKKKKKKITTKPNKSLENVIIDLTEDEPVIILDTEEVSKSDSKRPAKSSTVVKKSSTLVEQMVPEVDLEPPSESSTKDNESTAKEQIVTESEKLFESSVEEENTFVEPEQMSIEPSVERSAELSTVEDTPTLMDQMVSDPDLEPPIEFSTAENVHTQKDQMVSEPDLASKSSTAVENTSNHIDQTTEPDSEQLSDSSPVENASSLDECHTEEENPSTGEGGPLNNPFTYRSFLSKFLIKPIFDRRNVIGALRSIYKSKVGWIMGYAIVLENREKIESDLEILKNDPEARITALSDDTSSFDVYENDTEKNRGSEEEENLTDAVPGCNSSPVVENETVAKDISNNETTQMNETVTDEICNNEKTQDSSSNVDQEAVPAENPQLPDEVPPNDEMDVDENFEPPPLPPSISATVSEAPRQSSLPDKDSSEDELDVGEEIEGSLFAGIKMEDEESSESEAESNDDRVFIGIVVSGNDSSEDEQEVEQQVKGNTSSVNETNGEIVRKTTTPAPATSLIDDLNRIDHNTMHAINSKGHEDDASIQQKNHNLPIRLSVPSVSNGNQPLPGPSNSDMDSSDDEIDVGDETEASLFSVKKIDAVETSESVTGFGGNQILPGATNTEKYSSGNEEEAGEGAEKSESSEEESDNEENNKIIPPVPASVLIKDLNVSIKLEPGLDLGESVIEPETHDSSDAKQGCLNKEDQTQAVVQENVPLCSSINASNVPSMPVLIKTEPLDSIQYDKPCVAIQPVSNLQIKPEYQFISPNVGGVLLDQNSSGLYNYVSECPSFENMPYLVAACNGRREEKGKRVMRLIGKRLYIDGFVYVKNHLDRVPGRLFWRCRRYQCQEKCQAFAITSVYTLDENLILFKGLEDSKHNHRPSLSEREEAERETEALEELDTLGRKSDEIEYSDQDDPDYESDANSHNSEFEGKPVKSVRGAGKVEEEVGEANSSRPACSSDNESTQATGPDDELNQMLPKVIHNKLYIDGFEYHKNSSNPLSSKTYWKCTKNYPNECRARAITSAVSSDQELELYKGPKESRHNHRRNHGDMEDVEKSTTRYLKETKFEMSVHCSKSMEPDVKKMIPATNDLSVSCDAKSVTSEECDKILNPKRIPTIKREGTLASNDSNEETLPDNNSQESNFFNKAEELTIDNKGGQKKRNQKVRLKPGRKSCYTVDLNYDQDPSSLRFIGKNLYINGFMYNKFGSTSDCSRIYWACKRCNAKAVTSGNFPGKKLIVYKGPNESKHLHQVNPADVKRAQKLAKLGSNWRKFKSKSVKEVAASDASAPSVQSKVDDEKTDNRKSVPSDTERVVSATTDSDHGLNSSSPRLIGRRLCIEGYTFVKNQKRPNGKVIWECRRCRSHGCRARAITSDPLVSGKLIIYRSVEKSNHNHSPSQSEVEESELRAKLEIYKGRTPSVVLMDLEKSKKTEKSCTLTKNTSTNNESASQKRSSTLRSSLDADNTSDTSSPRLIGKKLYIDGYIYSVKNHYDTCISWECQRRSLLNKICSAKAVTSNPFKGESLAVYDGPDVFKHNHSPSLAEVQEAEQCAEFGPKSMILDVLQTQKQTPNETQCTKKSGTEPEQSCKSKLERSLSDKVKSETSNVPKKRRKLSVSDHKNPIISNPSKNSDHSSNKPSIPLINIEPEDVKLINGKLHVDGHIYVRDQTNERFITWHCRKFLKKGCPARATTNNPFTGGELSLLYKKQQQTRHNHLPSVANVIKTEKITEIDDSSLKNDSPSITQTLIEEKSNDETDTEADSNPIIRSEIEQVLDELDLERSARPSNTRGNVSLEKQPKPKRRSNLSDPSTYHSFLVKFQKKPIFDRPHVFEALKSIYKSGTGCIIGYAMVLENREKIERDLEALKLNPNVEVTSLHGLNPIHASTKGVSNDIDSERLSQGKGARSNSNGNSSSILVDKTVIQKNLGAETRQIPSSLSKKQTMSTKVLKPKKSVTFQDGLSNNVKNADKSSESVSSSKTVSPEKDQLLSSPSTLDMDLSDDEIDVEQEFDARLYFQGKSSNEDTSTSASSFRANTSSANQSLSSTHTSAIDSSDDEIDVGSETERNDSGVNQGTTFSKETTNAEEVSETVPAAVSIKDLLIPQPSTASMDLNPYVFSLKQEVSEVPLVDLTERCAVKQEGFSDESHISQVAVDKRQYLTRNDSIAPAMLGSNIIQIPESDLPNPVYQANHYVMPDVKFQPQNQFIHPNMQGVYFDPNSHMMYNRLPGNPSVINPPYLVPLLLNVPNVRNDGTQSTDQLYAQIQVFRQPANHQQPHGSKS